MGKHTKEELQLPFKQSRNEAKCLCCGQPIGNGSRGLCNKHYLQYKRWGDPFHHDRKRRGLIDGYYRDGKTGRREHRIIYEKYTGVPLKKEEIIHHINFDKTDNRIENLYKYENASEHVKAHKQYEKLIKILPDGIGVIFKDGRYVPDECWNYIERDT